jgi:hypothetical protein
MAIDVPQPQPDQQRREPPLERVVIRSLPKAVYLYPTMLAALVAGLCSSQDWGKASLWGTAFLIVFAINLAIIAFDFPRTTSLTLLFLVIATVLGAILLNQRYEIFPWLERQTSRLTPEANSEFYWLIAGIIGVVLALIVLIHLWFDYWEVLSNELIHHHGILGSLERFPSPGIKLDKEIIDVFEFLILGAGRLVITPAGEGRPIVLENVPRIERVERYIKEVLGVTEVEIHHD